MFCTNCGAENEDGASFCTRCGRPLSADAANPSPYAAPMARVDPQQVNVPTYLAQSILVTIFCCLIPGIVAIVYSAQVNGKLAAGDLQGAQHDSRLARNWGWVAFGLGLGFVLLYVLLIAGGAFMGRRLD